jgi:hypothetical protein
VKGKSRSVRDSLEEKTAVEYFKMAVKASSEVCMPLTCWRSKKRESKS